MSDTVNLSFRYVEPDYIRAVRAHYASRLRLPLDITVTIILAIVGTYEWQAGSQWFGIICLCVSALFALLLIAVFVIVPRIAYRRQPKLHDEYSLRFSPEGIHFRTPHINSELQWSMYSRALVDAHSFILYYGSDQFTVIPKRVFEDDSQRQAFAQLLEEHVQVTDKTKRSSGQAQ